MTTFYQYHITFEFRNGRRLEIMTNKFGVNKGPNSSSTYIWINDESVASLRSPAPMTDNNKITLYYEGSPLPKLQNYYPTDWDLENENFQMIDKIIIDSNGRYKHES